MNTIEVLRYGSQVRLHGVDLYGFCGRENHPTEADVGFIGIVVANSVELDDLNGPGVFERRENVLGGTELPYNHDGVCAFVCYKVRASDGRELDLMSHEIEAL